MRHFLFEFITGGGLSGHPLPEALIAEGEIMLQTLIRELSELDDIEIALCRDSRLSSYDENIVQHSVEKDVDEVLNEYVNNMDVHWLIAPETDSCLEKYTAFFIERGGLFIGSSVDAIRLATSKYLTNQLLSKHDVKVVETKWVNETLPESKTGWVVKPDDGVGAENARLVDSKNSISSYSEADASIKMIVQPYIEGNHMSMSLLVFKGEYRLLACNQQYIEIEEGCFKLTGIGVNECLSFKNEMNEIARKIVSAIPGLAAYIGVDLIELNGEIFVLEINPRFTSAYAGISKSIGCNLAAEILNTFLNKKLPDIKLETAMPVRVNL